MHELVARNRRRSLLLVATAFLLLFAVAGAVNAVFVGGGWVGLGVALVLAGLGAGAAYFGADRAALAITGARQISHADAPQLWNVVEEMAIAAGLPMPKIAVIDDPAPNAFATGRDPEHAVLAFTTGLLRRMNRDELQGVVAHEMSHVLNRDTLVATLVVTVCGAIVVLCDLFWRFSLFGGSSRRRGSRDGGGAQLVLLAVGVLVLVLAPLGAAVIRAAVSRRREALADATAVTLSRNPSGLRAALEKLREDRTVVRHTSHATAHLWIESPLERTGGTGWLNRLYDTHPPLEERIAALRTMETAGPGALGAGAAGAGAPGVGAAGATGGPLDAARAADPAGTAAEARAADPGAPPYA